jgi:hypothetical protein
MSDNRDWISYDMPFKAQSILCLPYRPTYGNNPYIMKFLAKRQPFVAPFPTIVKRTWDISCSNLMRHNRPNCFGDTALKQQMCNSFLLITKITWWIANPIPLDHVILGKDCIVQY